MALAMASSSSCVCCLPRTCCFPQRTSHFALFRPRSSLLLLRSQSTVPPVSSTCASNKTLLTVFLASAAFGFVLNTLATPDVALASHSSSFGVGIPVESDMSALALGPEGPLLEEFWDNMRRYGFYFLTVASGGIYSLLEPLFALLKNPLTAILSVVIISGTIYLLYLTLNTMLGINAFSYRYS